jgi:hypothetical protein
VARKRGWPTGSRENFLAEAKPLQVLCSNYRWAAESSRPGEKILASAFAVHAPASVLPMTSMIPMLARPDLATRTSANSDPGLRSLR